MPGQGGRAARRSRGSLSHREREWRQPVKFSLFTLALAACSLAGCEQQPEGEPIARAQIGGGGSNGGAADDTPADEVEPTIASQVESACRSVIFENTSLTHCLAVPARHRIATDLSAADGGNYRSLSAFAGSHDAETIAFAMNAGMFDEEGDPIGYYVEDSERLKTLNTADGEGNFHLEPNGVFFGSGESWEVRTTAVFLANVSDRPEFGTQSGPMLVIDGKLHPEISSDGESRLIRNSVGVDAKGRAHFVISNAPISFGKLARFYRDELSVPNALYLDGNVSALWNPATGRLDTGAAIGPLIVVEKRASAEE
ncbi:MAG: phosphodiester glycosidase family protein [Alphaproteobacteria bacterium]|nr:phosphodiester glycosidase family protein [Alphaproteobacteria bacterium]